MTASLEHTNCTGSLSRHDVSQANGQCYDRPSESSTLRQLESGLSLKKRAQGDILNDPFVQYLYSIHLLPDYLRQPGSSGLRYTARLERIGYLRVDAAHMNHRHYNGVQIVHIATYGNFENKVVVVPLVQGESADSYKWYFDIVPAQDFPLDRVLVFSDRQKVIIAAADALKIRVMSCTRNIVRAPTGTK
ncbi:hypothetical protein PybrP1_005399 [[Pythium] brassicae (nom. inval.)]|nr:hypothetical protein PybrP1_005399 [[Pythium] brassicae (nom. inval.)]